MNCCHRWEYVKKLFYLKKLILFNRAHKRLNLSTIRAKLIRTTFNDLKVYLGSSLPNLQ
jgi:uncharacterized ParB-like nuclease family protein